MAGSGLITILFTDLVGSTAMAQELGDNAADDLRRTHFEQLRRAVATTDGTEVKTIGDAMMVSYTSAADAIAGAVAMQQLVDADNIDGTRVEMRVGVSAGDATYEDGDWFGTPVVEAARLCSAADGGQILISDIVRVLAGTRSAHEVAAVGPIEGKGLPGPISACEVRWTPLASSGVGRLELPLPPQVEQVDTFGFVGRDDQHQALLGAWKTVLADGRLAVFVGGEPGIGKTRLVKELCRTAHFDQGVVLWGSCDEELGVPYQPFVEAFRWLAAVLPQDQLAELVGPLGSELAPLIPELERLLPGIGPRLSDDPDTERNRLFEATTELLANLSEREPVVIVLDDVHWARKPTLLLLRHLLKTTAHLRLLIVATYRDTDLDRTHPLSEMLADLRRQAGVERLMLHGLDERGVVEFLERTAGHELDAPGLALAAAVARETEGNPFFIGEVLRHLTESGALVFRDGRWTSDFELNDVGIPEGVREVIGRRLSHLDSSANEVLAIAAVIGREFDLRLLGAVVEGGAELVLDAVADAETAGLVEAVAGRPGTYRFAHALVRSTLYDELPTTRRLRLHRTVGLALESSGDVESRLAQLAWHFTEAAAFGEVDKAIDYNRRAGDVARSDLAFEEAAGSYERALEVLELTDGADPALEARLLLAAGDALHVVNDPRGRELLLRAEEIGRSIDDVNLLAQVLISLSANMFFRGTVHTDLHHVAIGNHVLERETLLDPEVRAGVLSALAVELFWSDESERMRELSDRALDIARERGDPHLLADVLRNRNYVHDVTDPSSLDRALAEMTETIDVAAGVDDRLLCQARLDRAVNHVIRGDVARGDEDLAEAERLADRLRISHLIARSKNLRAARALLAGDLDACESLISDYEAYCTSEGIENGPSAVASMRYRLQYERGDLADLESLLEAIIDAQPAIPVWRMALCGVYLQTDRPELCVPHVEAVVAEDFAMVPRNAVFLLTCSSTARIASQVGTLDAAESAYRYAAPFDSLFPFAGTLWEYPVGVGVGAAAAALGRYDDAERHFHHSRTLCERAGAATFRVATDVHEAEMLAQRDAPGDARRASALATQSLDSSERLGLEYMRRRSEALLAG
jgi:class 3 adenylate cyclase/tetratricopeptide (TPR) repeat protein